MFTTPLNFAILKHKHMSGKTAKNKRVAHEATTVGKFGVVGVLNTLIDFTIFNALQKFLFWAPIPANVVSTTVAMGFSFFANKQVVFEKKGGSLLKQALIFVPVTAFGLYVIQNAIIFFFVHAWPWPMHLVIQIVRTIGFHWFSDNFFINNGAKAMATIASLIWNYIMYKKVVFKR
jgi:putative flippase GtrA